MVSQNTIWHFLYLSVELYETRKQRPNKLFILKVNFYLKQFFFNSHLDGLETILKLAQVLFEFNMKPKICYGNPPIYVIREKLGRRIFFKGKVAFFSNIYVLIRHLIATETILQFEQQLFESFSGLMSCSPRTTYTIKSQEKFNFFSPSGK